MEKIDIVILWVDGNDKKWLEEKNKYLSLKGDSSINRFRDWQNLQYLFRGIEKYAQWVNKVFFITWGHLPKWLNTNNEKLVIVKHDEFIPQEYLPTFNSNVIEMNLHRIDQLSPRFIVFNDDLFILKHTEAKDFFKNGLPRDMYIEYQKKNCSRRHTIMRKNYLDVISKYFNKKEFITSNFNKVFNIKYGINNIRTAKELKNKGFGDFYNQHLTQSFLKETFGIVWEKEYKLIDRACKNKFRADTDIGSQLCRYWQLLTGKFEPSKKIGKYYAVSNDNRRIVSAIKQRKYKIICINDTANENNFEKSKKDINSAFESVFKQKSTFEI